MEIFIIAAICLLLVAFIPIEINGVRAPFHQRILLTPLTLVLLALVLFGAIALMTLVVPLIIIAVIICTLASTKSRR